MRTHKKFYLLILVSLTVLSCASTRTSLKQYAKANPLVKKRRYTEAAAVIEKNKNRYYKQKDRVLYWLDLGMIYHWGGEYKLSNFLLTEAELAIEELFTKSISKALVSGLLNENALDYFGEDYENIYINVFKALNYIALGEEEAAGVEIRRVQNKLNLLEDKYKNLVEEYNKKNKEGQLRQVKTRFHNDALGRYLSLLLYRSEGSFDDARIDLKKIEEAWRDQPQLYDFILPILPKVVPDTEHALVNILSFTGLSPVKMADTFYVDTLGGFIGISSSKTTENYASEMMGFDSLYFPGLEGRIHFKIQFPRLKVRGTKVDRIVLSLDGKAVCELQLLENLDLIAAETFKLKQPLTVGGTIIRVTIKNVGKELGKRMAEDLLEEEFGEGGKFLAFIGGLFADIIVDATENADLRISHFLPSRAWAAECTVPEGSYDVSVEYWKGRKLLMRIDHGRRRFTAGKFNFIESHFLE